jgi:hypothetical protein
LQKLICSYRSHKASEKLRFRIVKIDGLLSLQIADVDPASDPVSYQVVAKDVRTKKPFPLEVEVDQRPGNVGS